LGGGHDGHDGMHQAVGECVHDALQASGPRADRS
jgi:hypothetical protein